VDNYFFKGRGGGLFPKNIPEQKKRLLGKTREKVKQVLQLATIKVLCVTLKKRKKCTHTKGYKNSCPKNYPTHSPSKLMVHPLYEVIISCT